MESKNFQPQSSERGKSAVIDLNLQNDEDNIRIPLEIREEIRIRIKDVHIFKREFEKFISQWD